MAALVALKVLSSSVVHLKLDGFRMSSRGGMQRGHGRYRLRDEPAVIVDHTQETLEVRQIFWDHETLDCLDLGLHRADTCPGDSVIRGNRWTSGQSCTYWDSL